MDPYQWVAAVVAVLICAIIIWLIRHDSLSGRIALSWLAFAVVIAVFGIFPKLTTWITQELGIVHLSVFVLLAAAMVLIKLLRIDMERTRNRQHIRVLAQKIAIMEARQRSRQGADGNEAE